MLEKKFLPFLALFLLAFTLPGRAELMLSKEGDLIVFSWVEETGVTGFDLYRGELTAPFAYGHDEELLCDLPADFTEARIVAHLTGGPLSYYLFCERTDGERDYGRDSSGRDRPAPVPECSTSLLEVTVTVDTGDDFWATQVELLFSEEELLFVEALPGNMIAPASPWCIPGPGRGSLGYGCAWFGDPITGRGEINVFRFYPFVDPPYDIQLSDCRLFDDMGRDLSGFGCDVNY